MRVKQRERPLYAKDRQPGGRLNPIVRGVNSQAGLSASVAGAATVPRRADR